MAVDHALFESVQAGGPSCLRFYLWDPPCLSLGRNQYAAGLYDEARAAEEGVDIVRRPTGGLAVLHHFELTYSVLAPLAGIGGPRRAYADINRALVAGLARCGVAAAVAGTGETRDPRRQAAEPCFDAPAPGEVVAAGRKLVGSAQRCERNALLQHGSILLDGTQAAVSGLLKRPAAAAGRAAGGGSGGVVLPPPDAVARGAVTLAALLGAAPAPERVAHALCTGFESVFGIRLAPSALSDEERQRAATLEAHYCAASWTWRR
jgi:lipoyl(octanoyl) transferase